MERSVTWYGISGIPRKLSSLFIGAQAQGFTKAFSTPERFMFLPILTPGHFAPLNFRLASSHAAIHAPCGNEFRSAFIITSIFPKRRLLRFPLLYFTLGCSI